MNALKFLPASVGIKALEKYNPKFGKYFAKIAAYGLDTNRALDFLKDRFEQESTGNFKSQLEQRAGRGSLRPDEMAAQTAISNSEIPGKIGRSVASLAGGLIGAGGEETPAQQEEQTPQQMQRQPNQQQAVQQYNEMIKKRKLIDQMQQEFEQTYGGAGRPMQPQANQQPSGQGISKLQETLEKYMQLRGNRQ